jgi:Zn-dependent protease with chaperone function
MPEDIVLTLLREIRADAKEAREENRRNFGVAFHRLSVLEATMASLKADMATLLSTVPVVNERLDQLEARLAAVEARLP